MTEKYIESSDKHGKMTIMMPFKIDDTEVFKMKSELEEEFKANYREMVKRKLAKRLLAAEKDKDKLDYTDQEMKKFLDGLKDGSLVEGINFR